MSEERRNKVIEFLRNVPASQWDKCGRGFDLREGGFNFSLYYFQVKGELCNLAEGGVVVGEGDNSEIVHSIPYVRGSHGVTLDVKDVDEQVTVGSYYDFSDDGSLNNYVNGDGSPISQPPLFELYRDVHDKIIKYNAEVEQKEREMKKSVARAKLDDLLSL